MNKIFEIILRKLPFLKNNFLSPIFILLFLGSGLALIGALISQYIFDYQPCILCIYQRIPFGVIILLSLTALILRKKLLINKIPEEISRKKILQGSRILLKRDLRRYSISTRVYKRLTEHGYAIISDQTHFDPAKGLWMKLARDSDENYKLILVDIDYGAIKDENGNTLCYNGSNYPEEQLWTTGSDFTGYNLVLGYY
jgi:hypothetical protein